MHIKNIIRTTKKITAHLKGSMVYRITVRKYGQNSLILTMILEF
jgi:hypothetical protein